MWLPFCNPVFDLTVSSPLFSACWSEEIKIATMNLMTVYGNIENESGRVICVDRFSGLMLNCEILQHRVRFSAIDHAYPEDDLLVAMEDRSFYNRQFGTRRTCAVRKKIFFSSIFPPRTYS
jgi:hypothetical protein